MRNGPVSPVLQYNHQCCTVLRSVFGKYLGLAGFSPVLPSADSCVSAGTVPHHSVHRGFNV